MKGKRIAVVGAGSIGLYYGAKLAAQGYDIHFFDAFGIHARSRIRIRIHSGGAEFHLAHPNVAANPQDIGPCDGVIVAVKATSNEFLPSLITPLVGGDTWILTMRNGLGNEELSRRALWYRAHHGSACLYV